MVEKENQVKADSITKIIATFFGAGYSPILPGTVGTLFAIPLYYAVTLANSKTIYIIVTLVLILLAIPISERAEKIFGKKDARPIVIDEVAGYLVTMTFFWKFNVLTAIIGFVAFRFFDIVKIPPINFAQKIEGGLGVVADDIIAGIYACIASHIIMHFIV